MFDFRVTQRESCTMSATIVREKNQTTLPADVLEAAGIRPKDQVEWSFEDGKIVGRKLQPVEEVETLDELPRKLGKVSNASIREAVRVGRR
jgi:bifunctional DNA-binding transcriptional regulator/antitoxin component of YhaV-PrlF toxin-antitoxin module